MSYRIVFQSETKQKPKFKFYCLAVANYLNIFPSHILSYLSNTAVKKTSTISMKSLASLW